MPPYFQTPLKNDRKDVLNPASFSKFRTVVSLKGNRKIMSYRIEDYQDVCMTVLVHITWRKDL